MAGLELTTPPASRPPVQSSDPIQVGAVSSNGFPTGTCHTVIVRIP